jgi:hypothetical protein
MSTIKFTQLNPAEGQLPTIDTYTNVLSFDLVSDQMTVTIDVTGYDSEGNPTVSQVVREYAKADWLGEEVV